MAARHLPIGIASAKPNLIAWHYGRWERGLADRQLMASDVRSQATSTELTGGAGFTYEDTVVAYYLAALLREGHAAGQDGVVTSVAVQQSGHGHPMDDLIVEFTDGAGRRVLGLQVKRQLRISAALANNDFRQIMAAAVATRESGTFLQDIYAYGFVAEHVATDPFRSLNRLIDWAKASSSGEHFEQRFVDGGAAAAAERALRLELNPLTGATTADSEASFFRHFVALKMDGLGEGGVLRAELINQLQELVAENRDGQDELLFDRLCRIARDGAGNARKWTRTTLLDQLRGVVRLRVAPNYVHDLDALQAFSLEGLADISETIDDFHVTRPALQDQIGDRLAQSRLVNISGLPGCGKSAVLKHFASDAANRGPILLLKSDRLAGHGWSTLASALGLRHSPAELLAEIGATGTPILFIDGIDRVRPTRRESSLISSMRSKQRIVLPTGRCSQARATKDLRRTGLGFRAAFIEALALATFQSGHSLMTRRKLWHLRNRTCGGFCLARWPSGKSPGDLFLRRSWPAAWPRMKQHPKQKLTSLPRGGPALATTRCQKPHPRDSGRCSISRSRRVSPAPRFPGIQRVIS
jgi:hypothetical protein